VLLDPPPEAQRPTTFRLTGKEANTAGSAEPGKRTTAEAKVCIPANGHADLALTTDKSAFTSAAPLGPFAGDRRIVGLHLSGVTAEPTDSACPGSSQTG
jgi:hypothetical protein